jgi:ribosomal-protein-alanine N-acetyltransferase
MTSIETPRLILRIVTPELYNKVFLTFSIPEIMRFFGFRSEQELEAERLKYEGGLITFNKSFLHFHLIDKATDTVIGSCGYHTWYTQHARAEIGYALYDENNKGKGFMKEAFFPVIEYGFRHMGLNRIEALIGPGNIPSLKLVKAMGFKEEGLLREHYCKNGFIEDSLVFSLLSKEFGKGTPLSV